MSAVFDDGLPKRAVTQGDGVANESRERQDDSRRVEISSQGLTATVQACHASGPGADGVIQA
jgi:hypothetical protein